MFKKLFGSIKVEIKRLNPSANLPTYSYTDDGAMDLVATSISIQNHCIEYGTGIALDIPRNYCALLLPRNMISKEGMIIGNSVELVDPTNEDEIKMRFYSSSTHSVKHNVGDVIGQIIIVPYPIIKLKEVQEFSK